MIHSSFFIRVRYADTDKMGVVYNSNYLKFFEIGRTELMRQYGLPYKDVEEQGYLLPLIDSYLKFINPARYDDNIEIYTILEMESLVKIKFNYELRVEDRVIATGYTRHTFVGADSLKPVRTPKFFQEIIQKNI
jgi:acyl-CoA thioester hydrolase